MDDYRKFLNSAELGLLREVEPKRLAALDEDELIALHTRVRKARDKSATIYRRTAARTVQKKGSRGLAHPKGAKNRLRAEVMEDALATVSDRLARVAHDRAEELKADRLAAARKDTSSGPEKKGKGAKGKDSKGRARTHTKTTGGKKRDASSRAKGARRQAKKDDR